jgi:hypothetical protein
VGVGHVDCAVMLPVATRANCEVCVCMCVCVYVCMLCIDTFVVAALCGDATRANCEVCVCMYVCMYVAFRMCC